MDRDRGRGSRSNSRSRGRSQRAAFTSPHHRSPWNGADGPFSDERFGSNDGMSRGRGRNSHHNLSGRYSMNSSYGTPVGNAYRPKNKVVENGVLLEERSQNSSDSVVEQCQSSVGSNMISKGVYSVSQDVQIDLRRRQMGQTMGEGAADVDLSPKVNIGYLENESQSPLHSGAKDQASEEKVLDNTADPGDLGQSEKVSGFDICLLKTGTCGVVLKPSIFTMKREERNETQRAAEGLNGKILRPGMVLLKNYLSMEDQAKIVKQCRDLGIGPGGFYQPGYRDGGRLHLKMMCLGRNWDPDRSEYVELRPIDGAKPPILPNEFQALVKKAIKDSHALIERNSKVSHVEGILPSMSANICIVNFYTESGRLGLHQDKDESPESLHKGLPVVSFSIGDSGEFLYGDKRDAEKAEKVKLESGDVLIFGGKSRHIFHGISSVLPNTAPKSLLDKTNLRKGRLNLTFREY